MWFFFSSVQFKQVVIEQNNWNKEQLQNMFLIKSNLTVEDI